MGIALWGLLMSQLNTSDFYSCLFIDRYSFINSKHIYIYISANARVNKYHILGYPKCTNNIACILRHNFIWIDPADEHALHPLIWPLTILCPNMTLFLARTLDPTFLCFESLILFCIPWQGCALFSLWDLMPKTCIHT